MMNVYKKFLDCLFKISKDESYFKFLLKNHIYFLINIFIISNENKLNYEKICKKFVPKFVSRSTVKSILNEGVRKKFIEKYSLRNNKKNKYYKLSNIAKKNLNYWVECQKEIFNK